MRPVRLSAVGAAGCVDEHESSPTGSAVLGWRWTNKILCLATLKQKPPATICGKRHLQPLAAHTHTYHYAYCLRLLPAPCQRRGNPFGFDVR